MRLRIGTRGSRLALWQAEHVAGLLRPLTAPDPVELVLIETTGDQVRDRPLAQIGGEGLFTKEIQKALLDGRVDVAVHSLKDLPTIPVPGLVLAAVPTRGPVGDVLISRRHASFADLSEGARVATSSLRRRAMLLHRRPDLQLENIRGNVETRLRKLEEAGLAAIILAEAGLCRLGLERHITERLDVSWMLPAVGQGALGLECRADDGRTLTIVRTLNDPASMQAVTAERSLLAALGGGCLVPIGALGLATGNALHLRATVVDPEGKASVASDVVGPAEQAQRLGEQLAQVLLSQGAGELLRPVVGRIFNPSSGMGKD